MKDLIAQYGDVELPVGVKEYGDLTTGLPNLISNLIKTLIVIAGLYAVFNFVFAGYTFMSAGGDPKKIADAWAKIWQTLLGLVIAAGAFVIAAIVGGLVFKDYNALLQLKLFGPN